MHEISLKRFSHLVIPTPGSRLPCPTCSPRRQLCCTDHMFWMTKMQEYSRLMTESSNWFTFWSDKYYWSGGNQFLPALFIFSTGFSTSKRSSLCIFEFFTLFFLASTINKKGITECWIRNKTKHSFYLNLWTNPWLSLIYGGLFRHWYIYTLEPNFTSVCCTPN